MLTAARSRSIGPFCIDCIEKMPANAEYLRGLGWVDSVLEADFLSVEPQQIYDRVLMNPVQQTGGHPARHALAAFRAQPNGRLFGVMAAGSHLPLQQAGRPASSRSPD